VNHAQTDEDFWDRYPEHLKAMGEVATAIGLKTTMFVLGDSDDENAPAAAILKMPPNYVLARHAHTSERAEVILAGSLSVGDRVLLPGDVMTAGNGEMYGDHIAGPDCCTTVEIFSILSGARHAIFATPDGPLSVDIGGPEAMGMLAPAP
jgi:hypothetical protein